MCTGVYPRLGFAVVILLVCPAFCTYISGSLLWNYYSQLGAFLTRERIVLACGLCLQAPHIVDGSLVQAAVSSPTPSCLECDEEEQGEVL